MNPAFSLGQEQSQRLTQYQILSLGILAMDQAELERYLQEEFCSNPMLEQKEGPRPAPPRDAPPLRREAYGWDASEDETPPEPEIPVDGFPAAERLILEQLDGSFTGARLAAARRMAACLDEDGYWRLDEAETQALTGLSAADARQLLSDLKKLEPAGLFAQSVEECLALQLERQGVDAGSYKAILACGLPMIAAGKIGCIAQATGLSRDCVRRQLERLRALSPRPLAGLGPAAPETVVPDVVFTQTREGLAAELNDGWMPDYGVSDHYLQLMRSTDDPALREYFQTKHQRAGNLLRSIQQRRATILAICEALGRRQRAYVLRGGAPEPLTLEELARELEIHPSTVSRAVKGKYAQLPWGCVPLRSLFSVGAVEAPAGAPPVSRCRAQSRVRELIAAEDAREPYSDQQLAALLAAEGIPASRRAVAKYREELLLPSSYLRRRSGGDA